MNFRGRFLWHDLITPDGPGAEAFYPAVTGWRTAPVPGPRPYRLWLADGVPVGGCLAESRGDRLPRWLTHVGTPNVDETVAQLKTIGGAVVRSPESLPGVGRFAVVADPFGATFGLFAPVHPEPPPPEPVPPGWFSWHELTAPDPGAALAFYRGLFGWESAGDVETAGGERYHLFGLGGPPLGGVYRPANELPEPAWLPFVRVADADRAAGAAQRAGGNLVVEPKEVKLRRIAVLADPRGRAFAVHSLSE
ncbi:MAG: VOC family protein [Gemmatimonadales bacterium]